MALAKGTNILHVKTFADAVVGEGAWKKLCASLSAEDRATLDALVAVGWYDLGLQIRVIRAVDQVLGNSDLALVRALGKFEADQDLTRIHRLFLRLANPALVLEKAGEYWSRFYDSGQWLVKREAENRASGALTGLAEVDPTMCAYLQAYIAQMFELAGGKDTHVDHTKCRARGDTACVFAGHWRA